MKTLKNSDRMHHETAILAVMDSLTEDGDLKLYAISDLHLDYAVNRDALKELPEHGPDWLITGGDLCTKPDHLRHALDILCDRFSKVFWVPGNHELWSATAGDQSQFRGEGKYMQLVEVCREYGVLTPEDPFVTFPDVHQPHIVAPLFIPYDYSFRPDDVTLEGAIPWAMEAGILCRDEKLIHTDPFPNMVEWCAHRVKLAQDRLSALDPQTPLIIVNHFPLREDLVRLWRIPRFSIWCGTKKTEAFHTTYPTSVVISGHLHMRATDYRDGVRFEEVSLGYPRDWDQGKGMDHYLREILPLPSEKVEGDAGPFWRFR